MAKRLNIQVGSKDAIGAEILAAAASKSEVSTGDGTSSTAVLTQYLINKGLQVMGNSTTSNAVEVKKGLESAANDCVSSLHEMAHPLKRGKEALAQIAAVSTGDAEMARILATAFAHVGYEGEVTVEQARDGSDQDTVEFTDGYTFDRGYESSQFATAASDRSDWKPGQCVLEGKVSLLLVEGRIEEPQDIIPALKAATEAKTPLLILADELSPAVIRTVLLSVMSGQVPRMVCVKSPGYGVERTRRLEDLAAATGASVVGERRLKRLHEAEETDLGTASSVSVGKSRTVIKFTEDSQERVDARAAQLRAEIKQSTSRYERSKLQSRLASLKGGVAAIRITGDSELVVRDKGLRYEDGIGALKAAMKGGVLPGGGAALLAAAGALEKGVMGREESPSWTAGYRLLVEALPRVMWQIAENSGADGDAVVERCGEVQRSSGNPGMGYNAIRGRLEDLPSAGILDPALVVESVVRVASATAASVLLTEALRGSMRSSPPSLSSLTFISFECPTTQLCFFFVVMGCGASLCRSSSAAAAAPPPPAEGPARGESKGPALAATDGCDNGLGTSIPPVSPSGGEEEMEDLVGTFYQRRVGDADGRAWRVVEALARGGEQSLDDLDPIDWNGMWRSVSSKVLKLVGGVEALKGEDVEAAAAGLFVTELANDTHYFPFELLFRESNKVDDAVRLMKKLSCLDEAFMNTIAIITTTEEFRSAGAAVAAGVYCRRVPADSEEHRRAKAEVKRAEDRFVCLVEMEPGVVVWSSALVGRGEEVKALRVHRTGGRRRQVLVFRNADTCHEACVFSGGQEVEWGWVDLAEEEQITLGVTRVEARARAESEVDFDICGFPYALRVSFPDGACPDRAVCLRARQALRRQIARGGSVMEVCKAALKDLDLTFAAVPFIVAEELRVCREETRALEVKFMHNRLVPWCVLMVARACKYTARRYGNALPGSGSRAEGRVSYSEALFCVLFNTAWDGKFSPSDDPAAIASTLYVTLAVLLSAVGKEAPPAALVLGLALLDPPELLRAMAWELRVVLPESTVEKTLFRRRGRRPGIFQAVEGAVLQPGSGHMIELQAMLRPSRVYTVKPRLSKGRGESSRAAVKVHESLGVHWLEEQVSGLPLRELLLACCLPSPLNLPNSRLAYYRMRLILQGAWSAARRSGSAGVLPCFPNLSRSVLAVRPSDPELLAGLWCTKGVAAGSSNSPELSSVLFLQALAMLVSKGGYGDPRARLGQGERIVAWLAWRLGKHAYVKGEVLKVEKYGDIFRGCGEAARDGMNFEPPRVESGPFLDRAETARDLTGGPLRDEEVDEVLASSMADVDVKRFPWAMDLSRPYPVAAFQRSPQGVGQIVREYKQVPAAPVVSDTQEVTRGTCFGFGSNDRDQLGVRSITEASSAVNWTARPVRLMCLKERRLVDVSAGDSISAAVCDEGRLYVWGSSFPEVSIPRFPQGVVVETVSCAASAVVALSEDGRLWQLGDLTSSPTSSRVGAAGAGVLEISLGGGASRAAAVSCGSYHAIAIDTRGRLWAWGRGEGGQLGIEDVEAYYDVKNETIVTTPTMLAGDISSISFASVSCGEAHSAAVTAAGQLYCWGWGEFGQLGLGFSADTFPPGQGGNSCRSPTPKVVEVGSDRDGVVTAVSCGGAFTACLTTLGDVWTWGSNESGQLALPPGDPMELTRPRKVSNVPPGKRFKNVSCGFAHVLAIDAQGQVHAWGSDCYGQLGLLNPPAKSSGSWIAKAPPPRTSRQSCEYVPSVVGSIGAVRMGACAAGYGHSLLLSDPGGEGSSYRARRSEASSVSRFA
ncbi:hypothetical protein FOZ61_007662 [Perkinsus olseni]|uniref:Uncharacterized protein n=1 Tax=Perkinsus olseni TaxID=32597 RepID=A0A7J6L7Y2_PEROL|nr:hypothetical protein FOZ61_007662 [Perkinsus olseni]